jgi:8-oxo-dGTP diphosphatase
MIDVVAAVIIKDGKVLLAKRPKNKHQGGKWEFPGGKIEPDEKPLEALKREIKEEINLEIFDASLLHTVEHHYPDKSVRILFFKVHAFNGEAKGLEGQDVRWHSLGKINQLDFPDANKAILSLLNPQAVE